MVHILLPGTNTVHLDDDHIKADVSMLMLVGVREHTMIVLVTRYRMVLHTFMANTETFLSKVFQGQGVFQYDRRANSSKKSNKQNTLIHFKAFAAINTTTSILVYPTLACHSSCESPLHTITWY